MQYFAHFPQCEALGVLMAIIMFSGMVWLSNRMKREWGENPKGSKWYKQKA